MLIKQLSVLPLVGSLFSKEDLIHNIEQNPIYRRDYFKELGVRTFINAAGTYTALTGSLMGPEVIEAIKYASGEYAALDEMQDKVGERIASLLHCEAATVTSGAASAITLGTAGILTGLDEAKINRAQLFNRKYLD
jgi:L-seryl-tRNA(Ser) seleniumtransferase